MSEIRKKVTKVTLVDRPEKMRPQGTTYSVIIPQIRRAPTQREEPVSKRETKTN